MKQSQINAFKKTLQEELDTLQSRLDNPDNEVVYERGDEMDNAKALTEKSLDSQFRARDAFYISKIKAALKRIEDGSYGICPCGDEITIERLKARPTSEMCIACKEEAEAHEGRRAGPVSKSYAKIYGK